MRTCFLFAAVIAITVGPAYAEGDDYAAIQYSVDEFIAGIREGDASRIAAVSNLTHGHAMWPQTKDGKKSIVSVTFGQMIEDLKPYEGYGAPHKFLGIEIIGGELAVANIVSHAPRSDGDGVILEYFVLSKVESGWQVIALPWIFRPGISAAEY
jgi:hypothetical protein